MKPKRRSRKESKWGRLKLVELLCERETCTKEPKEDDVQD